MNSNECFVFPVCVAFFTVSLQLGEYCSWISRCKPLVITSTGDQRYRKEVLGAASYTFLRPVTRSDNRRLANQLGNAHFP